ncbi:MAG: hypothetical protein WCP19_00880 [Chloroflexota bacterium]
MCPVPDPANFSIRSITSPHEFHLAEILQRDVWGIRDDTEIVPKDILLIVQKNGGLCLGAFDQNDELAGLLFGFLGQTADKKWKHCSHMLGVLPAYRNSGISSSLKKAQRDFVLQQGLDLITWTVSPLEGKNSSLNFRKLGGVCRNYLPNFYGDMEDELNHGIPSDRFEMEWWIRSRRVENRLQTGLIQTFPGIQQPEKMIVNPTILENEIRIPKVNTSASTPLTSFLFEVPADIQLIKKNAIDKAVSWIDHTRKSLEQYFRDGFIITDFFTEVLSGERRNFFLLEKNLTAILENE